ncbi:hypothetical protein EDC39_11117 [Geothermobacter ehrlichii]|uniref:Uncharacterized protein n=1 Tax=Geothermobacter ehrlichii TaxID=213224 RepID=A0A5D3WG02_9BACT|nr:ATP-binding protein [Geothermobacter ehrlichii]TYO97088.1 hypothetical protein EDC39_11117 [Geothermobacter ehrlichii]
MNRREINWHHLLERIERLIELGETALERQLVPDAPPLPDLESCLALRWRASDDGGHLEAIAHPDLPDPDDLLGIDRQLAVLRRNTRQFVRGLPANNVLLWGERGTGKSTAVRSLLSLYADEGLRLVELQKEHLFDLRQIASRLRPAPWRFILYCDDLSFDEQEIDYRELKALLEGGLETPPENMLIYATSNRRHLIPEKLTENTGEEEIHPEERIAEKLSLSDRFGISLGFYPFSRQTYLAIVHHLAKKRKLDIPAPLLEKEALSWAAGRGSRSGRVARQFVDDLTGRLALGRDASGKEAWNLPVREGPSQPAHP